MSNMENKPPLLVRPMSAHEDPINGFTFAKAKPAQSMDFSKRSNTGAETTMHNSPIQASINKDQKAIQPLENVSNNVSTELHQSSAKSFTDVPKILGHMSMPRVSFPHMNESRVEDHDPPSLRTTAIAPTAIDSRPQVNAPDLEVGDTCDDTKASSITEQRNVTHGRPKSRSRQTIQSIQNEDLLRLMMYRLQQEKQSQQGLAKVHDAQAEEIRQLRQLNNGLGFKVEEMKLALNKSEANVKNHENAKKDIGARLQRLKDFLNGLGNDHSGLRNEARKLHSALKDLQAEGQTIRDDIRDLAVDKDNTKSMQKERVLKSHHEINLLEQDVQNLRNELRMKQEALDKEQARNKYLEQSNSQLLLGVESIGKHTCDLQDMMNKRLDKVIEISQDSKDLELAERQGHMASTLDQCLEQLRRLNQYSPLQLRDLQALRDSTKDDYSTLCNTIHDYAKTFKNFSDAGHNQLKIIDDNLKDMKGSIQDKLDNLEKISEATHSQQNTDQEQQSAKILELERGLREAKSAVERANSQLEKRPTHYNSQLQTAAEGPSLVDIMEGRGLRSMSTGLTQGMQNQLRLSSHAYTVQESQTQEIYAVQTEPDATTQNPSNSGSPVKANTNLPRKKRDSVSAGIDTETDPVDAASSSKRILRESISRSNSSLVGRGQKLSKATTKRDSKMDKRFREELGRGS